MSVFITRNGIKMLKCKPLNWEVIKTYAIDCDPNPENYVINIGSMSDMWQALLMLDTMVLSFCSLHYSKDEVYRFTVKSVEEASELVLKFAKGMGIEDSLDGTIYTTKMI